MGIKSLTAMVACGICICLGMFAPLQQNDSETRPNETKAQTTISKLAELESRIQALEQQIEKILSKSNLVELKPGLVPFEEVVLNLGIAETDEPKPRSERYVKMSIVFEVEIQNEKTTADAIELVKPRLMNSLISIVSEKHVGDFRGRQNLENLRSEIRDEFNARFTAAGHPQLIKAVLFDELNVQ